MVKIWCFRNARGGRDGDALSSLELTENPDVLATLAARKDGQVVIGFAAVTGSVPGLAWLEFHVGEAPGGQSTLRQRATFFPRGLAGHSYWFAVLPFHGLVFPSMVRRISAAAVARDRAAAWK